MTKNFLITFSLLVLQCSLIAQRIPSKDTQIIEARMCLSEEDGKNATIYGYDEQGQFVKLRVGTNNFICLADDPKKSGFSVAAYHKNLDPYMARGRQLKNEGKKFQEIFKIRGEEIEAGNYNIPDKSTLYVMNGEYDENGAPIKTYLRYVFYIPFATARSTGLPTSPVRNGGPWIMDAGTYRAHIMINPINTN